jgi:hypothetical protein
MPGRMSNRERIERMRAEADATAKEKAERAKAPKAATPKKKASAREAARPAGKVRFVWSVCGPSGKEVQRFPYAQETEARAEAVRLTESTGSTHFVSRAEVAVE